MRHYLQGNYTLQGTNSTVLRTAQVLAVPPGGGPPFTRFVRPNPLPNTGVHRYIYALYVQPPRFNRAGFESVGMSPVMENWNVSFPSVLRLTACD